MAGRWHRLAVVVVGGLAALMISAGCSGKKDDKDGSTGSVSPGELKRVALALLHHSDLFHKGPSGPDDLAHGLLEDDQRLLKRLRSGDIVVSWDAPDLSKLPGGVSGCVLAYERDAPTKGGHVVMGDVAVKKVSADEFKGLKLAGPEKR